MKLTRRRFVGVAATALWASGAGRVAGARYIDRTGLKNQSFIWQPDFAPSGPVTIIVSLGEQVLHVFRGHRLLGIARCQSTQKVAKLPAGAFRIDNFVSSEKQAQFAWQGTSVYTFNTEQTDPDLLSGARSCIDISPKFAKLLKSAVRPGTLVIMAPERTPMLPVRSYLPTALRPNTDNETSPQHGDNAAFIFTRGTFGQDEAPSLVHHQPISIVVSSHDRRARIVSSQQPVQVVEVDIAQPQTPLGAHAYCLTTVKMGRSPGTWIATGLSAKSNASHIHRDHAKTSLDRISFIDPEVVADVNNALSEGACVVLTDAPLDDRDNATFIHPVLLTAGSQTPNLANRGRETPTTLQRKPAGSETRTAKTSSNEFAQNSSKLGGDSKASRRQHKKVTKKKAVVKRDPYSSEPLIGPKNFQDP
ncbi:MAG: hypothetical protein ACRBCJ_02440 [Hyphomicrobiaceae bacterium]